MSSARRQEVIPLEIDGEIKQGEQLITYFNEGQTMGKDSPAVSGKVCGNSEIFKDEAATQVPVLTGSPGQISRAACSARSVSPPRS